MTKYKKIHLNICYLLITRPPKRTSKLQEKPSALKREHPALQKIKCVTNCFIFLWVIYAPIESGSNPNPQQWLAYITYVYYLPLPVHFNKKVQPKYGMSVHQNSPYPYWSEFEPEEVTLPYFKTMLNANQSEILFSVF